ncbi:MAG: hypothetical protein NTV49_02100 [Kiritimatiellaeota bacterium]|nr:hypothetical protein [Kiritimatiellota bacterium]
MNLNVRRILRIWLFGIVSIVVYLMIGRQMEASAGEGYFTEAALNKLITVGMSTNEVVRLFGQPDSVDAALEKGVLCWSYQRGDMVHLRLTQPRVIGFTLFVRQGLVKRWGPSYAAPYVRAQTSTNSTDIWMPDTALMLTDPAGFLKAIKILRRPAVMSREDKQAMANIVIMAWHRGYFAEKKVEVDRHWAIIDCLFSNFDELRKMDRDLGQKTAIDLADMVPLLEKAMASWGSVETEKVK